MALSYHEVADLMMHLRASPPIVEEALSILEESLANIRSNEMSVRNISEEELTALPPETELHPSSEAIWKIALGRVDKLEHQGDAE